MLPRITTAFIVVGFIVALIGAFSRGHVRHRLQESGVGLKTWATIGDEVRYAERHLKMAKAHDLPAWPAILAVVGIPSAFVLMVLGLMLGR
jgi:hypothetical protein